MTMKRVFDKTITRIVLVLLVGISIIIAIGLFNNTNIMSKNGFIIKALDAGMYEVIVDGQMKIVDIGLEGWTNEQNSLAEKMSMQTVELRNYTVDENGFLRPKAMIAGNMEIISAIKALNPTY